MKGPEPTPRNSADESRVARIYGEEVTVLSSAQKVEMFPIALERGRGALLWDADGREYIDFSSGGCNANIGYGHPHYVQALSDQAAKLSFNLSVFNAHEANARLARRLAELVPITGEKKVLFAVSGTDACEAVYKLVKSYNGRPRIITNMGAVHGFTMGALSLSGFPGFSKFLTLSDVTKVPFPYCYRCPLAAERATCGIRCLSYVEDYVFRTVCEPEVVAAWVIEVVQGDAGYIVPPPEYLEGVERICRKHGILLVADEILMGLGRSGRNFAFEHFQVHPDVVILGKALGGGIPLGAVVGREDVMERIPGEHVSSMGGGVLAMAAGLAVLDVTREEDLAANARSVGACLLDLLKGLVGRYRVVGDVRGLGLGIGVEIVDHGDGKSPAPALAREIAKTAARNGVLMFVLGILGNVLMVSPPLVLSEEQARFGAERLESAIREVERRY